MSLLAGGTIWLVVCAEAPAPGEGVPLPPSAAAEAAHAGEIADGTDEILVVAAPVPVIEEVNVDDDGIEHTVVAPGQIEDMNAMDVPSAVRRVPGAVISRYNLVGSYGGAEGGAVFIRGMGTNRPSSNISFLVDGKPKMNNIWTHGLMDQIGLDAMDEIDIVKSPQPVTLGTMGFAAIEFRTKRVEQPGRESSVKLGYGSFGTVDLVAEHGENLGEWDYFLLAGYKASDGHRERADGELQNYFGRVGYELSDAWDLSFTVQRTDNTAQDPGPESTGPPLQGRYSVDDTTFDLTFSSSLDLAKGSVKLYYSDMNVLWEETYDPGTGDEPRDNYQDSSIWGVRLKEEFEAWEKGTVTVGYDHTAAGGKYRNECPLTPADDFESDWVDLYNTGPYASARHEFALADWKLTPSGGLRYNLNKEFGGDTGFQTGMVARRDEHSFHLNYADAFNLPGVCTAFQWETGGWPGDWTDMGAEKVRHWEVGWQYEPSDSLRLGLTCFSDAHTNAIRFAAPPPRLVNIGEYDVAGIELAVEYRPARRLALFLGGSYMNPHPGDTPYVTDAVGTLGLTWRATPGFKLTFDAQYVGKRWADNPVWPAVGTEMDPYFLANMRASYRYRKDAEVYLAVENLFDADYEFQPEYPMPGTTLMAGTKVKF